MHVVVFKRTLSISSLSLTILQTAACLVVVDLLWLASRLSRPPVTALRCWQRPDVMFGFIQNDSIIGMID